MKSKIFGVEELKELKLRIKGGKNNYKIWYKIKPKIIEILDWAKYKIILNEIIK